MSYGSFEKSAKMNRSGLLGLPLLFGVFGLLVIHSVSSGVVNPSPRDPVMFTSSKATFVPPKNSIEKSSTPEKKEREPIKPTLRKYNNKIKKHYNTSCGEITCSNVKNYPAELIRELLLQSGAHATRNYQEEKPTTHAAPWTRDSIKAITRGFLSKVKSHNKGWTLFIGSHLKNHLEFDSEAASAAVGAVGSLDFRSGFTGNSYNERKREYEYTRQCKNMNNEESVQEAVTAEEENVYVAECKISVKCEAPEYCEDLDAPEDHWHHCVPKIEHTTCRILKGNKLIEATILIANGCDCKLERKRQD